MLVFSEVFPILCPPLPLLQVFSLLDLSFAKQTILFFSRYSMNSSVVFYKITSEHDSAFELLVPRVYLRIFETKDVKWRSKMDCS